MTLSLLSHDVDQADASGYTFAARASGTAGNSKFLFIWGRINEAGDGFPATASIGGQALTKISGSQVLNNIGSANPKMTGAWFSGKPTVGGNQDIVCTYTVDGGGGAAKTMIRGGFILYESADRHPTPLFTDTDGATTSGDRTLVGAFTSVSPSGLQALGAGVISVDSAITCTLTNLTEDVDTMEGSGNSNYTAGNATGLGTGDLNFTWTWSAGGLSDDAIVSVLILGLNDNAVTPNSIVSASIVGTPDVDDFALVDPAGIFSESIVSGLVDFDANHVIDCTSIFSASITPAVQTQILYTVDPLGFSSLTHVPILFIDLDIVGPTVGYGPSGRFNPA